MTFYIRFRMSCSLVLPPHIPPKKSLICFTCVFLVFRSSFQFLGSSAVPSPAVPVITSSGRVAPTSVGDTLLSVEDAKYRVQKLFPPDGTVVLQKINTRYRPFKRFIVSSANCGSHGPRPMMPSPTLICHLLLACVPTQTLLVSHQTRATRRHRWIFYRLQMILTNGAP